MAQNSHSWGSSRFAAFSSLWMMLLRLAAFFLRRLLSFGFRQGVAAAVGTDTDSGMPNRLSMIPPRGLLVPEALGNSPSPSSSLWLRPGLSRRRLRSSEPLGRPSAVLSDSVPSQLLSPSPPDFPARAEGDPPSPAAAWISSIKSSRRIRDLRKQEQDSWEREYRQVVTITF